MTAVRERPIIFTGPSMAGILAGTKTQTRRPLKEQPEHRWNVELWDGAAMVCRGEHEKALGCHWETWATCPYGAPGDRLWVRETWAPNEGALGGHLYRADHGDATCSFHEADLRSGEWVRATSRWRPSIHMPRVASRITLEVTEVRVERLQAITEDDARAEGLDLSDTRVSWETREKGARVPFARLWDEINARRPGCSWDANPWVWALTFRLEPSPDSAPSEPAVGTEVER